MTIAASFTPKYAILSFAITHELLTKRLFLDSLANNNFRMKKHFLLFCMAALALCGCQKADEATSFDWLLTPPRQ